MMDNDAKCPFCRVPAPTSEDDMIERYEKRVEKDDAVAIYNLGCCYNKGTHGMPQDWDKALEMFHRAGELGCSLSYYNIGCAYYHGRGVEKDEKKAQHFWEIAAVGGNESARFILGLIEENAGNMSIALKHHMIAVGCGHDKSLKVIREFYVDGHATKDDYAKALQSYQKYVYWIKSDQRDEAAAFDNEKYRYY